MRWKNFPTGQPDLRAWIPYAYWEQGSWLKLIYNRGRIYSINPDPTETIPDPAKMTRSGYITPVWRPPRGTAWNENKWDEKTWTSLWTKCNTSWKNVLSVFFRTRKNMYHTDTAILDINSSFPTLSFRANNRTKWLNYYISPNTIFFYLKGLH